jgi:hypothetical protein
MTTSKDKSLRKELQAWAIQHRAPKEAMHEVRRRLKSRHLQCPEERPMWAMLNKELLSI